MASSPRPASEGVAEPLLHDIVEQCKSGHVRTCSRRWRISAETSPFTAAVLAFPGLAAAPLSERPLVGADQADEVADLFKVLASDTRLRLLHALARGGEVRAGDLAAAVGMGILSLHNWFGAVLPNFAAAS